MLKENISVIEYTDIYSGIRFADILQLSSFMKIDLCDVLGHGLIS